MLAWNVFVVSEEVPLRGLSGVVDEDVGVGCHPCHGTDHVAGDSVNIKPLYQTRVHHRNILIQDVQLLC